MNGTFLALEKWGSAAGGGSGQGGLVINIASMAGKCSLAGP